jgi:O-antigen/teichoic acid export membrane protein
MILSRLLTPDAFGLMALVSTMIVAVSLLSDVGLSDLVVQSPRGDEPLFLNTAFTFQALRGVGIWMVSLLAAWPVSIFFHEHRLLVLIPVFSATAVLGGFYSTNLLSLNRNMGVKHLFAFDLSTQVFGIVVSVTWALIWPSVWALVAGTIAYTLLKVVASHNERLIPGIKNRFMWDPAAAHSLIRFGRWIWVATATGFFASQADRLILAKFVSFATLGVYGIAFNLSDIPRQVVLAFCGRVGFPFLAKLGNLPRPEFRRQFLHYRFYVLTVGGLLLSGLVMTGDLLVSKLYDKRYYEATWMLPILAIGLWHTLLYSTIRPALYSVGRTQYNAVGNMLYLTAIMVALPLGYAAGGLKGVVIAVAAGDFPLYLVNVYGASREGVSTWEQDLKATVLLAAFLALGFALRYYAR